VVLSDKNLYAAFKILEFSVSPDKLTQLASSLSMTKDEAEAALKKFYEHYPKVKEFHDKLKTQGPGAFGVPEVPEVR
jgi:hypothetical protein